jgi:TolB protein
MSASGGGVIRVTNDPANDDSPSWSPSGGYIAFASTRDGGDYDIFTINEDGSELSQLTFNDAKDTAPAWSPNGGRIAFVSTRDGGEDIYVMDTLGGNVVRLTSLGNAQAPTWSPDGGLILFAAGGDLYVVSAGGGAATPFYAGPVFDADPAWAR